MSEARLALVNRRGPTTHHDLRQGQTVVGRTDAADIAIDDTYLSSRHAVFSWDGRDLWVHDLQSKNGTLVNGVSISEWAALRDGDRVRLGAVEGIIHISQGIGAAAAPSAGPEFRPAVAGADQAQWRSVFISYASEDRSLVEQLRDHLQAIGWDVWMDQHALQPGDRWTLRIGNAIAASSVVLAVVSPAALQSQWVDGELQLATRKHRPILGLVVRGAQPDEIDNKFGLYLHRQRMELSELGERLGIPQVDEISMTLDRLAQDKPPGERSRMQSRVGGTVFAAGVLAVIASTVWGVSRIVAAIEIFAGLVGEEVEDRFVEGFEDYIRAFVPIIIATLLVLASVGICVAGWRIRRAAYRKALGAS